MNDVTSYVTRDVPIAQLAELFIEAGQMLSVCVCMDVNHGGVAQIVTAANRDL